MKLKTVILTGLSSVFVLGSIAYGAISPSNNKEIPIQVIQGNHVTYENATHLKDYADLVVIGKPFKKFEESQTVIKKNEIGGIEDFYTITPFKVKKIIKGNVTEKVIPVIQPAAIIENPENSAEKKMILQEDYSILDSNSNYLLYLKKTDEGNYSVVAVNQGKFNIDGNDLKEKKHEEENKQYKELKNSVLKENQSIIHSLSEEKSE
jgi:hypothetical protein